MRGAAIRAPLAAVAAAVALASCGGEASDDVRPGASGDAVARIDGDELAKADLAVRERFEAVAASRRVSTSGRAKSKLPVVIPYFAPVGECTAGVRRAMGRKALAKLTGADLREYCRSTAARIREYAVSGLLATRVTAAEAAARGIAVADAEIDKGVKLLYTGFGGERNIAAYTRRTGLARADLRERAREQLLGAKLRAAILRERGRVTEADVRREFEQSRDDYAAASGARSYAALEPAIRRALQIGKPRRAWERWQAEVARRWRPRIECHPGYVVANLCGNRPPGESRSP